MEQLATEQSLCGKNIERLTINFKKDSAQRKTQKYIEERIQRLALAWDEFSNRDIVIEQHRENNPAHPYFEEDYFNEVKQMHDDLKLQLLALKNEFHQDNTNQNKDNDRSLNENLHRLLRAESSELLALRRLINKVSNELQISQSSAYIKQRSAAIKAHWENVYRIHQELISEDDSKQVSLEDFYNTEDMYNDILTQLLEKGSETWTSAPNTAPEITARLPKINLPVFNGNPLQWRQFSELFQQLVHQQNISASQKMYYLRANVIGDASRLIHQLPMSGEAYETAWTILRDRYENKRMIVSTFISKFVSLPVLNFVSAGAIRKLHDVSKEALLGINNLGIDTSSWDALVIHLLLQKLDPETYRLFEQSLTNPREIPKTLEFLVFLEKRFQMLDSLGERKEKPAHKNFNKPNCLFTSEKNICPLCKSPHILAKCKQFLHMSVEERNSKVKDFKLCINCLRTGHIYRECNSRHCLKCQMKHNTLLHTEKPKENAGHVSVNVQRGATNAASSNANKQMYVFLATAQVNVSDSQKNLIEATAVLDSGSQLSFISEKLYKILGLRGIARQLQIDGIGSSKSKSQTRATIEIRSRTNNFTANLEVFVLPQITSQQPRQEFNTSSWRIPDNIHLADTTFNKPKRIDILLGADIYPDIMCVGQVKLNKNLPTFQNTALGWVVMGKFAQVSSVTEVFCGISTRDIHSQMERFWQIEEDSYSPKKKLSIMEQRCENHFLKNTIRSIDGRLTVELPFSQPVTMLGASKEIAMRRFFSIERRLEKNPQLKAQYTAFMNEYLELGHMIEISEHDIPQNHYFLPHHCVIKPESSTTKLRVVFDAACKTTSGVSLNDILMVGPTIQRGLFGLLLRFRVYKYVFTADVSKMYRQFRITKSDSHFQLIIWRDDKQNRIKYYRLCTITYGTSSASYLATRALHHLADLESTRYPIASQTTKSDFYVDDVMTGDNDLTKALKIRNELQVLLKTGGLELRKWCANDQRLLHDIPPSHRELKVDIGSKEDDHIKTLGMIWFPSKDHFSIKTTVMENRRITKRSILSDTAQLYDPLGLISPVITTAKILLQNIWALKLDWDAATPQEIHTTWLNFRQKLPTLNAISVPRHLFASRTPKHVEIHGFSDASEKAYGAAIYIRGIDNESEISVNLLCAKSRVAPLKKISLPRLELCAAALLTNLVNETKEHLQIHINKIICWTDSMITLSWIKGESSQFKTFVANRVADIQRGSNTFEWRHVPTDLNPADKVSRGMMPDDLVTSTLWFKGPGFLRRQESEWPIGIIINTTDRNEIKSSNTVLSCTKLPLGIIQSIDHRGSFQRLRQVIGFVIRFLHNLRGQKRRGGWTLTTAEEYEAQVIMAKEIQAECFAKILAQLKKGKNTNPDNQLSSFAPFLDDRGLIRVGGRLEAANIQFDAKHPIVLPYNHPIVKLMVRHMHEKFLHAGPQALVSIIRQQFWPLRAKAMATAIVRNCVRCSRAKPKLLQQLMGNLPRERVQPGRPFINSGIDFCGPFNVHYKLRGKRPTKAYIAVFVCFATKAVHLEIVTDLTTDTFIGALKRFWARRGKPSKIFSDNATNFVGANNSLKEMHEFLVKTQNIERIKKECAQQQIEWRFIPARSPHFGGLWEAAVKSAKNHLYKIANGASLTFEELHTLVTEIEGILNSRPITTISDNPNELQALTPSHFLIGEPLTSMVNPYAKQRNCSLTARWRLVQTLREEFWNRWSREYLHELQARTKWRKPNKQIEPGMLVIIKEDNIPPLRWPLGRIIAEHKGEDGLTRVVELKTQKGIIKRAVHKICLIPTESNEVQLKKEQQEAQTCQKDDKHEVTPKQNNEKSKATILTAGKVSSTSRKRKIHPIGDTWPKGKLLTPRSKEEKITKTSRRINPINICMLLSICATAISPGSTSADKVEIMPFQLNNTPGIYFEKINHMEMATDVWNIAIYYNLTTYLKQIQTFQQQQQRLQSMCQDINITAFRDHCVAISEQIKTQIDSIQVKNSLIEKTNGNEGRRKRSPLDLVGSIANKAFGLLDQEYAKRLEATFTNIGDNENHLLSLIKDQTSIIDNTENVLRQDRKNNERQFKIIQKFIDTIEGVFQNSLTPTRDQNLMETFNAIAIHSTLALSTYSQTQRALLDVVMDGRNGKINPMILTPDQLREEMHKIRENIPPFLRTPISDDHLELLQLYKLMTVQARVTNSNMIFLLKLPLLSQEHYEVFKVIPVPMKLEGKYLIIKGATEFLAVSLRREQYYPLEEKDLKDCSTTISGAFICKQSHAIYHGNTGPQKCELRMLTLNRGIDESCSLEKVNEDTYWAPMYNQNSWIYGVVHPQVVTAVCGTSAMQLEIKGEGILTFKEKCSIKHKTMTIAYHSRKSSSINISLPVIQAIHSNDVQNHLNLQEETRMPHLAKIKNNSQLLTTLHKAIEELKFKQNIRKIEAVDVHHFSISYITLAIVGIICLTIWKRFRENKQAKVNTEAQPPEPPARRADFQIRRTTCAEDG